MIKNVYFDLDGTLVDSAPGIIEGLKITLTKYGYDIPDFATLRKCVGPPFTYSFPNILHIRDEDFHDAVATYRKFYDDENGESDTTSQGSEDIKTVVEDILANNPVRGDKDARYTITVIQTRKTRSCIDLFLILKPFFL